MSYNVIVAAPLGNACFVVWFDGGVSKRYKASEVGIDEQDLANLSVLPHGEGLTWGDGKQIDSETLFGLGESVDYVSEEKARLLKDLSAIRRDASFSQTRLGEAAGIRQSVISRIEGCEISPQINTLLKLLAPLGKTLAIVDLED